MPETLFDYEAMRSQLRDDHRRAFRSLRKDVLAKVETAVRAARASDRPDALDQISALQQVCEKLEEEFCDEAIETSATTEAEAFCHRFRQAEQHRASLTADERLRAAREVQAFHEARLDALMRSSAVPGPGRRPPRRREGGEPAMATPKPKPTPLLGGAEAPIE